MTTTWYYPEAIRRIAPRPLRCSECRRVIETCKPYIRMNHGRYCLPCSAKFGVEVKR